MDEENIGRRIGEVVVESSESNPNVIRWSDTLLITGTTLVNGTIDYFLRFSGEKKLYFYGVTIASATYEFGLRSSASPQLSIMKQLNFSCEILFLGDERLGRPRKSGKDRVRRRLRGSRRILWSRLNHNLSNSRSNSLTVR